MTPLEIVYLVGAIVFFLALALFMAMWLQERQLCMKGGKNRAKNILRNSAIVAFITALAYVHSATSPGALITRIDSVAVCSPKGKASTKNWSRSSNEYV